uniref:Uncharacterized protein n=1 Tax=Arundo donax TaxID=35708 RepID=A0A0A9FZN0_ARUDO
MPTIAITKSGPPHRTNDPACKDQSAVGSASMQR